MDTYSLRNLTSVVGLAFFIGVPVVTATPSPTHAHPRYDAYATGHRGPSAYGRGGRAYHHPDRRSAWRDAPRWHGYAPKPHRKHYRTRHDQVCRKFERRRGYDPRPRYDWRGYNDYRGW